MSIKSSLACEWQVVGLGCRYLWTFTLRDVLDVDHATKAWSLLWAGCLRRCGFRGVRVFELHPNGHGVHVHLATDVRISVRMVRERMKASSCASLWGTGYGVDVTDMGTSEKAAAYLAKYLRKSKRCPAFAHTRIWAACGSIPKDKRERVRDIVCESPMRGWYLACAAVGHTGFACFKEAFKLYVMAGRSLPVMDFSGPDGRGCAEGFIASAYGWQGPIVPDVEPSEFAVAAERIGVVP